MRLYNASFANALAYMQLYSRTYWNSFNPDLRGVVRSPGYGSDNSWTYMNLRWAPGTERTLGDGRTYVNWLWGEYPESFNTMHASTVYAVNLIGMTQGGLMNVNPYTHADRGSMAYDWDVTPTPLGPGAMNVTFYLHNNTYWQDGTQFTGWDAKWNWEFLRDNAIPRYTSTWKTIQDVVVDPLDDFKVTVVSNETSQFLLYDYAGTAALMPPVVWRWVDGESLATITGYAPEQNTTAPSYPSGVPGYPAGFAQNVGSWFGDAVQGHPQTQLYGTGPWVYVSYVGGVATFERSITYRVTTEEIRTAKTEMFHAIGDVGQSPLLGTWNDPDGLIDVWDMTFLTYNFGYFIWEPPTDPDDRTDPGYRSYLDINGDGVIDIGDVSSAAFHQGKQKEYP
jgi:ABC-type transport system substrate-binding protein